MYVKSRFNQKLTRLCYIFEEKHSQLLAQINKFMMNKATHPFPIFFPFHSTPILLLYFSVFLSSFHVGTKREKEER
jgi:hypothetical protein